MRQLIIEVQHNEPDRVENSLPDDKRHLLAP